MILLNLGNRKKSLCAVSAESGGYLCTVMFLSARNTRIFLVSWCNVVVKQPQFLLPQLLPRLVYWAKHTPQELPVDLLIDSLALWPELDVEDALDIKECDQHEFCLRLFSYLRPRRRRTLPLTAQVLYLKVVFKNQCLLTTDDSTKKFWFSLTMLDDFLT